MARARALSATGGSGTLTAAPVAGSTTAGTAVQPLQWERASVSCLATVLAETNTLTLTVKFQVSLDNSTWYDVAGDAQNPANVLLATGTAGADVAVSRVFPVPPSATRWPWLRAAVVNGVATGAVGDTYAFTFQYEPLGGF